MHWKNCTGFMSKGKRHPKVPLILVPTGSAGVAGQKAD
jgi:hypothetical protein